MKNLIKMFSLFAFFAALISCSEEDKAIINTGVAPVLSADKTTLNYDADVNKASTALPVSMKFTWTKANYTGTTTPVRYTLEIPAKYPNPKKPEEIRDTIIFVNDFSFDKNTDSFNSDSYEIARADFRNKILRLNAIKAIDVKKPDQIVLFRLKSVVGDNGAVMYSNNFQFTLQP